MYPKCQEDPIVYFDCSVDQEIISELQSLNVCVRNAITADNRCMGGGSTN
jgi:hypothetical protein